MSQDLTHPEDMSVYVGQGSVTVRHDSFMCARYLDAYDLTPMCDMMHPPRMLCLHTRDVTRVPGLPIRDCARNCNNREHTPTQLTAIHLTSKVFFDRLYLVLGLSPFEFRVNCQLFESRVNCPYAPPTARSTAISRFLCNFFPKWPLIFGQHTIHQVIWQCPSTLDVTLWFAVCCSVLRCAVLCCSVSQCVAVCLRGTWLYLLQGVAVYCSVLQCVAVCCSMLQCVAVCIRGT